MAGVDIRQVKRALRDGFKAARRGMEPQVQQQKDQQLLARILRLPEYAAASTVLTYVSTSIEVDTHALIRQALADGKRVAVPRCTPGRIDMKFYLIEDLAQLEPGAFGVLEPDPERCRELRHYQNSICILPGLGYDLQGYRLG